MSKARHLRKGGDKRNDSEVHQPDGQLVELSSRIRV